MKQKIKGLFRDVGVAIRVKLLGGSGVPEGVGGQEHSHDFVELIVFHGGRGVHSVDGRDYPIISGDVFVVLGDQTHALVERHDLQYAEVSFNAHRVGLPYGQLSKLPGYHALFALEPARRRRGHFQGHLCLDPTHLAEAMRRVEAMHREYSAREEGYEAALVGRLAELMVYLSRQYARATATEAKVLLRVGEVISRLERDSARPWRLDELCQIAHMSKSALMVAFRDATGHTPVNFLIRLRLRHAMELLASTSRPITQIAFDAGFSDSNYFARKFRQVVGTTPTAYRESAV